jgi:hypothetical protein
MDRSRRTRARIDEPEVDQPPVPPLQSNPGLQSTNGPPTAEPARSGPIRNPQPKFHYGSELGQTINPSEVANKILDTTVNMSVRELLAVSSDVSGCIHDQTRQRRIPVEPTINMDTSNITATAVNTNVGINSVRPFYACPSGHAKVSLNREIDVDTLLDDGSELNLMPRRTFDQTTLPIDPDINWRINGYDAKTKAELESWEKKGGVIGVCHDVPVDIGGIEVKQHIFVVEHTGSDLILGMPWRRSARLETAFDDDGSYMMKIRSQDGR